MAGRWTVLAALVLGAALSGCAGSGGIFAAGNPSGPPVPVPGPAERPFDGPLFVQRGPDAHPHAGAAGYIVDCNNWGSGNSVRSAVYADGATTDRPEEALYEEGIYAGLYGTAADGLAVAKQEDDRVLYVLEVNGSVKESIIVRNGPATEGAGGAGWYVESWAICDASELPTSYTDRVGLQIWTDAAGNPVATNIIEAWRGPEHCDWESMTFLEFHHHGTFVRDPLPELAEYFDKPYRDHGALPDDAVDVGYQRDGRRLWLAPDESLAYVGTAADVEAWPREVKPLGCM
jgi:hypothetical protein